MALRNSLYAICVRIERTLSRLIGSLHGDSFLWRGGGLVVLHVVGGVIGGGLYPRQQHYLYGPKGRMRVSVYLECGGQCHCCEGSEW